MNWWKIITVKKLAQISNQFFTLVFTWVDFMEWYGEGCIRLSPTFTCHCMKRVRIRSFSGPLFLAFELNTERYSVSLLIQSECGNIRTRKTPNVDTFHAVCWTSLFNLFNNLLLLIFYIITLTTCFHRFWFSILSYLYF